MKLVFKVPFSNDSSFEWVADQRVCGIHESYLFGRAGYLAGGRFGPRIQEAFMLVVLVRGSLRVDVARTSYDLLPGEGLLLRPGGREFYRFADGEESEHTWCQVWQDVLSPRDRKLLQAAKGVFRVPAAVHVLIEEGLALRNPHPATLDPALEALARACLLRFAVQKPSSESDGAPPHPAYERACEIAANDFVRLRSAQELADRAGISATQLRFLFRQAGGESPTDLIWRLKIEHAVQLIRSTGLTLEEIASACGYANAFHLSRSIKCLTSHSPRELRRIEWGG